MSISWVACTSQGIAPELSAAPHRGGLPEREQGGKDTVGRCGSVSQRRFCKTSFHTEQCLGT